MTITFLISSDIFIAELGFPSDCRAEKCDKGEGGCGEGKFGRRKVGKLGKKRARLRHCDPTKCLTLIKKVYWVGVGRPKTELSLI